MMYQRQPTEARDGGTCRRCVGRQGRYFPYFTANPGGLTVPVDSARLCAKQEAHPDVACVVCWAWQ